MCFVNSFKVLTILPSQNLETVLQDKSFIWCLYRFTYYLYIFEHFNSNCFRWAFSTVIKRNKSISRRTTVQVQYSQNRWKKCKISLISVRNLRTQCNCFRESVRITNGGPGNTFMKLNISSEINCDIHSNVTLYIKC